MGDIWWDIFCPRCKEGIGGTCNTEEELKKQTLEYDNKVLVCSGCKTKFNPKTDEIIK